MNLRACQWRVLVWVSLVLGGSMSLTGCLSSGGGGGDDDRYEVPDLPEATDIVLDGRYQVLGEDGAIVLDTQTNLAWKRCPFGRTWSSDFDRCEGTSSVLSWGQAMRVMDREGFRLPSIDELQTLVYCSRSHSSADQIGDLDIFEGCELGSFSPSINQAAFPDVAQRTYWTSSVSPGNGELRLGINFASGIVSDSNSPVASYPLILVRDPDDEDPTAADGTVPNFD